MNDLSAFRSCLRCFAFVILSAAFLTSSFNLFNTDLLGGGLAWGGMMLSGGSGGETVSAVPRYVNPVAILVRST